MALTTTERTNLIKLAVGMFNAAPGATYLSELTVIYEANGRSLTTVANILANTPAYKALNPVFQTASEFAAAFLTPLGLQANAVAVDFVTAKFNAGVSKGQIAADALIALDGTTDAAFTDAKAILTNKTTVAEYYSVTKAISVTNVGTLQAALTGVTSAASTVDTAKATIDQTAGQFSGSTFALTTGADTITGTAGNDQISGAVDTGVAAQNTLTLIDVIDGGAGTDTLSISLNTALPAGLQVKNVEKISIKGLGNGTADIAGIAGLTNVESNGSTADVTISNIASNATLGLLNSAKNLTATYKDGTIGAAATVSLEVAAAGTSAAARSTITVGHAATAGTATDTTLAINASSGSSFITLAEGTALSADFKTVNISGSGKIDLASALLDNTTTVNASTNTGGVTIALTGNAKDVTVTGGSGADKVTLPGFTVKDSVDLGAGTDTLSVTLADAKAIAATVAVKNTEVLELTGGTGADGDTINADYFGVTSFTVAGAIAHNLTLTNTGNGGTVTINDNSGAAKSLTIDVKGAIAGTADTLTLTTDKDGADLNTQQITTKVAGVETLTVAGSATAGAGTFLLGKIEGAALKTIVITNGGGGAVTITDLSLATAVTSIDASAAVGATTVSAVNSVAAVTFKGGSKVDTYTASNKGDSITGGAGADVITLGTGADKLFYTAASDSTAAAKDVITGFNQAADLISFAASLQVGTATYLGAAAFSASAAKTQLRMNGADLEVDFGGDGVADLVVTLTGQTSATFGAANFTFA